MTVGTGLDLDALRAAIAAKDVASAVALFAEDVELEVVDERNRPGTPFRARGREAMTFALTDATEGLQHRITAAVADGERAAITLVCEYPTGQLVVGNIMLEHRGGLITRAHIIQAWDE
jgi:ketosteroid isomerase-like protein